MAASAVGEGEGEGEAIGTRFAALLKAEPFPPDGGPTVDEWRAGLWARAIDTSLDVPGGLAVARTAGSAAAKAHASWQGAQLAKVMPRLSLPLSSLSIHTSIHTSIPTHRSHVTFTGDRLGNFVLPAPVRELIGRLQAAGYATGVLTNGASEVQRGKLRACDAKAVFDESTLIVAGDFPKQKPDAKVFHVACAAMGVPVDATVMVGDTYKADVAGGKNAGVLATVWIADAAAAAALPEGCPLPDFRVTSVEKLESVLEQIG
jgi:phosphoglycolate phosphatase-like HAD superfamily hydrolase